MEGGLQSNLEWEVEDKNLSSEERTANVVRGVLNSILPGVVFTTEIDQDFPDIWGLPTLIWNSNC